MRIRFLASFALLALAFPARAAVIVVANYTASEITFTLGEPGEKPTKHTLPAHQVAPFVVNGPADLTPTGAKAPFRVDPFNPYAFIPDRAMGTRLELIELPGQPPERDARPVVNPKPRDPVKIPVTLLVDDADPRVDALWKDETRKRFDQAAAILEAQTSFRLEFAGFDTWKSDPNTRQIEQQFTVFEGAVKVKPGALAIGFTSRKLDDVKEAPFGVCSGRGGSHVLVREARPRSETEKVEVLLRYLAITLGAATSPDPGSAMRPSLGDGQALHPGFVVRLDPLNVLALNLWADQRRMGIKHPVGMAEHDRNRLVRVYKAIQEASPTDLSIPDILRDLEKDQAKGPDPRPGKKTNLSADREKRAEAVQAVIRAVTERAKANTGEGALTGDALTAELVRAAADAALGADPEDRVSVFLIGIGIALDDGTTLRDNPLSAAGVKDAETAASRKERLLALGNPTLRGRRDLCRRFAVGCAMGELLTPTAAENAAVTQNVAAMYRPAGFSFPSLAAECAGIAFARNLQNNPKLLDRMKESFSVAELIPDMAGLRDGIGVDKFEDEFGGPTDERFRAALAEIHKRVKALAFDRLAP